MSRQRTPWVFVGAGLLVLCNVDWVVIPILQPFFTSIWHLWIVVAAIANVELWLWYRFWRWFFVRWLPGRKSIGETIEFAAELKGELREEGYIQRVVTHFEETFTWASDPKGKLFKIVKAWGHAGMFFLGCEPVIFGGRLVGVVFCATTGWKSGLWTLMIGNGIHVLISVGTWEAIIISLRYTLRLLGIG